MKTASKTPSSTWSAAYSGPGSTDGPAPAREFPKNSAGCGSLDSLPAQDPAPTTMCERGLEPIFGRQQTKQVFSNSRAGAVGSDPGVILQERDREIMRTCYEQQFLLSEHVQRYFFHGIADRVVRKRLERLEGAGLLRREKHWLTGESRVIRLTRLGLRAIEEDIVIEVPQVRKPDVRTLLHDAIVTSVRLRLGELWTGSWLPERAIKQEDFPQIPDGLFIFPSHKKVAVEVENSAKSRGRFLATMERWRRVNVKLVLYVATKPDVFQTIQRFIPEGPRQVPFALVSWEDLKSGTPPVWTPDGSVQVFSQKEY